MTLITYWLLVLGSLSPRQYVEEYNLGPCSVHSHLEEAEIAAWDGETPPEPLDGAHDAAARLLLAATGSSAVCEAPPRPWYLD